MGDGRSFLLSSRCITSAAWLWRVRLSDPRLTQPSREAARCISLLYCSVESLREIAIRGLVVHHANARTIEVAEGRLLTTRVVRHHKRVTHVGPIGWLAQRKQAGRNRLPSRCRPAGICSSEGYDTQILWSWPGQHEMAPSRRGWPTRRPPPPDCAFVVDSQVVVVAAAFVRPFARSSVHRPPFCEGSTTSRANAEFTA